MLGAGNLWAASGSATIYVYAVSDDNGDGIYELGGGTVQASATKQKAIGSADTDYGNTGTYSDANGNGYDGLFSDKDYKVMATRKTTTQNYYFEGWYGGTGEAKGVNLSSLLQQTGDTYTKNYNYNASGKDYVYAVFKKIISPVLTNISWTKTEAKATYPPIEVNLYKASNLSVSYTYDGTGTAPTTFKCTPSSTSTANGTITLTLEAGEDVKDGDKFTIVLTSDNNGYAEIEVEILTKISATFKKPVKGKGSYIAIRTNSDGGKTCEMTTNSSDWPVSFTNLNDFYHTLTATSDAGYRFYRWVITDKSGQVTYIENDSTTAGHTLRNGDVISVEFLPVGVAQFMVKGENGKYYYELDEAIEAAKKSTSKTVVVCQSGILNTDYKTLSAQGLYEFEIPSDITLLVPGDDAYTVRNGNMADGDAMDYVSPSCYKYLSLEKNTSILVKDRGSISIYAKVSPTQGSSTTPVRYGQMIMSDNCHITLERGSKLTAYGYITDKGNQTTSSIVAQPGAEVYECFQFRDFRGGTVTFGGATGLLDPNAGMINDKERVFPMGQYYIQNIESNLILEKGAKEYVAAMVTVSSITKAVTFILISETLDNNEFPEGLFVIGTDAQVSKYYDKDKDRLRISLIGNAENAKINISYVYIHVDATITSKTIDSRNYVLPIQENMDLILQNIDVTLSEDFGLLGDAYMSVDKNSKVIVNSNVYIYDKDESKNLWYSGVNGQNATIRPVIYTPNKSQYLLNAKGNYITSKNIEHIKSNGPSTDSGNLFKRQYNDIAEYDHDIPMKDATVDVNGYVEVNGYIYTTISGANITSSKGNGKIYFKQVDKDIDGTELYRYIQAAEGGLPAETYQPIAVTNAKLHNDEQLNPQEFYSAGEKANAGETYLYYAPTGKWLIPEVGLPGGESNAKFKVTLPTEEKLQTVIAPIESAGVTLKSVSATVNGTGFSLAGEAKFSDDMTSVSIPVKYTAQNKHNTSEDTPYKGSISLTIKYDDPVKGPDQTYSGQVNLTANEDYTPKFKVTIKRTTFTASGEYTEPIVGTGVGEPFDIPVVIEPEDNNVAKTLATWISEDDATDAPFTFAYGEDSSVKLSNATLTYLPDIVGSHNGTLTITASYDDATHSTQTSTIAIKIVDASVDWQKNTLNFAQFSTDNLNADNSITPPFELLDMATDNAKMPIAYSLSEGGDKVVAIIGSGTISDPYIVDPIGAGTVTITVEQPNSSKVAGISIHKTITVLSTDAMVETVPMCVDNLVDFNIHTVSANLVGYNKTNNTIDFDAISSGQSEWVFQFHGVPNQLTFTPSGKNLWYIQERSSKDASWTNVAVWTPLTAGQQSTFTLLPTTRQVRIQYGRATAEIGTIAGLCVNELTMRTDVSKLYLPIYHKLNKSSKKTIVITRTDNSEPVITLDNVALSYTKSTSDNLGTTDEPYYNDTIIVQAPSTIEEGTYTLTAKLGDNTTSVKICAFKFPQELPIKLATDKPDNGDRYYFVTTTSDYAQWDAVNRNIVFQNPGAQLTRTVTFAFNGAPSIIKFDVSANIDNKDWRIYESIDGQTFAETSIHKRTIENKTLVQELNYTTRYVRVAYNSPITSELTLSNLVIEGYPQVIVRPQNMQFTSETTKQILTLTAINLSQVRFAVNDGIAEVNNSRFAITTDATNFTNLQKEINADNSTHSHALGLNKVGDIVIGVKWLEKSALDQVNLTIYNSAAKDSVLAIVPLVGADDFVSLGNAEKTGIFTGIPDGTIIPEKDYTYHGAEYTDYEYHEVNLTNAFSNDGIALFDYLFIYGETTPSSGYNITAPEVGSADGSKNIGSNAVTPYYIYKKAEPNAEGKAMGYKLLETIANANVSDKSAVDGIIIKDTTTYINVQDSLRIYMTGFCPYATTGYSKNDEGVWFFRGKHGAKLDIYLEDCHIFSRNKTQNGNAFYGNKEGGATFSDGYARGSGGVLVFENTDSQEQLNNVNPFEVNIHTIGNNLLKSNYGCFFILLDAMKAYQISAPIHVRLNSAKHVRTTKTTLNFDDLWPTAVNMDNAITATKRTNGFLGLKKQSNNAPSIDLGNPHTVVNFRGGQVELQNAQIVSENYKTTLAISYRSGEYGGDDVGIKLSYGIGTDSVGGTVNFYDGTTTVEPMWVKEGYKQYYLIDTLSDVKEWTKNVGTEEKPIYEYRTSCLRTPKNTYVYGGSHCFMRACQHVTSKGGAPKDGPAGSFLGQYVYTMQEGDSKNEIGLATSIQFPNNLTSPNLRDYHLSRDYTYGLNSVAPDANEQLYFWIPDGYGGVSAEEDKFMSNWKACMTEIRAGLGGVVEGGVGGDTPIEPNEEVKYFLYCQIDDNIHNVIADTTMDAVGNVTYNYKAPVEVPSVASRYFDYATYTDIAPTYVSDTTDYQVLSDTAYTITDRVFYVTTATADIWETFTAPFDVAKIYVVETYPEDELLKVGDGKRDTILISQAHHNADFAAFFAVAMAIGTTKDFKSIFASYKKWAYEQDKASGVYTGTEKDYNLRNMQVLTPYFGNNWRDANFYLNHNSANWNLTQTQDSFAVKWDMLTQNDTTDGILLHKGETYSLMFPYCTGCEASLAEREYWDYWSGKFLIFESVNAPQIINGRDFLNSAKQDNIFTKYSPSADEVAVTGNSTFSFFKTNDPNVYVYNSLMPAMNRETFMPVDENYEETILPTTAFLYGQLPTRNGMPARSVNLTGKINYDNSNDSGDGTTTGGHIPTVGGGNDLFITSTATGINVAVTQPQQVRVMSATGAIIFSGMVQTAVDVLLPTTGVYVITGENEVHKILH